MTLQGRNVIFIPDTADKAYFAAASIALNQNQGVPSAILSYDPRLVPAPITRLPRERVVEIPLYSPLELAVEISPRTESFVYISQRDRRWSKARLGEGGETIGQSGCFVTALAMLLEDVYGTVIWPDALADLLVLERDCFNGDYLDWIAVAKRFSRFTDATRRNGRFEPGNLRMLIDQGARIIVANPKISHFAYLLDVTDGYLVADPIAGIVKWRAVGGIRSVKVTEPKDGDKPVAIFVQGYEL